MVLADQLQSGDAHRHPHGVPADLPPSKVQLLAASVRALPVTQEVPRFPEKSRRRGFAQGEDEDDGLTDEERGEARAMQQCIDMGRMHAQYGLPAEAGLAPWIYRDQRRSGRRYRPTNDYDDVPQEPYAPADAPTDMPWIKFVRGW
jgi:hypothetical protein